VKFAGLISILLAPALAVAAESAAPDSPWEVVSDKGGTVVDRRVVEGSNLKEFRGRGVIDAPLDAVLAVFSDIDRAVEWMDSCAASSVVENGGDRVKVVYNRTRAAWPVSDRDAVLRNVVTFDERSGRVAVDFVSVTDARMPPVKGVVRMPSLRGHWYLWPTGDGRATRVEYQVHANPGGALPDWIVNYVSRELPRKTINGLRAQLKRRSYPDLSRHIRAFPEVQALAARFPALAGDSR
jgi:hypothetical protein